MYDCTLTTPAERREARREAKRLWWERNVWFPLAGAGLALVVCVALVALCCLLNGALNVAEGLPVDYPSR
jgi:hypothetical protein